jgi:hypothetical protein
VQQVEGNFHSLLVFEDGLDPVHGVENAFNQPEMMQHLSENFSERSTLFVFF